MPPSTCLCRHPRLPGTTSCCRPLRLPRLLLNACCPLIHLICPLLPPLAYCQVHLLPVARRLQVAPDHRARHGLLQVHVRLGLCISCAVPPSLPLGRGRLPACRPPLANLTALLCRGGSAGWLNCCLPTNRAPHLRPPGPAGTPKCCSSRCATCRATSSPSQSWCTPSERGRGNLQGLAGQGLAHTWGMTLGAPAGVGAATQPASARGPLPLPLPACPNRVAASIPTRASACAVL